jgi:hypothetical protein
VTSPNNAGLSGDGLTGHSISLTWQTTIQLNVIDRPRVAEKLSVKLDMTWISFNLTLESMGLPCNWFPPTLGATDPAGMNDHH